MRKLRAKINIAAVIVMSDLDDLICTVFSKPPQDPKTIQLQLSDDSDNADVSTLQLIAGAIAGKGAEKLYGVQQCNELTKEQFETLQKYLMSMGFRMDIRCAKTGQNPWETGDYIENVMIKYAFV